MPSFVMTDAVDGGGSGYYYPSGGAATLLDGIQADDTKYVTFDTFGASLSEVIEITIDAPADQSDSFEVNVLYQVSSSDVYQTQIYVNDGSGTRIFEDNTVLTVPEAGGVVARPLSKVYGGTQDLGSSWQIFILHYAANPAGGSCNLDHVYGTIDGTGGSGVGGQVGPNASFFMQLCGVFPGL